MPKQNTLGHYSLTKIQKFSIAGVATLGAAALAFSFVPGNDQTAQAAEASTASTASTVAFSADARTIQEGVAKQQTAYAGIAKAAEAAAQKQAAAEAKAKAEKKAEEKAKQEREAKARAARDAARKPVYANNLDGWIKESLAIMKKEGIPGTYEGLHRNIMRESSGNPRAINNWDINAQNGVPSKGLLQVIKPTFDAYHVEGTPHNQYDPVANIVAAANYAADRYGTIDNVDSAY
ncbi:transglycosylase SLT domain-containing protein [Streptomyces sp. B-S-A8]|uniref:Transglycosylase SLT domain-containing protein n=1 Tax=Streptomyces solicavernae TaxID=3043614 RepID=A0ABT6RSW1_9ACTN|nr:transglycosylase SLT domain-containing protein [Streptomyces sp. B-S-A8]MDI3387487.1 transglycosylase SLT domain-containing protein [Streptomyces sp. B-S-A8]